MISFKGCHFPRPVVLHAIHFYLRYLVSLRDLEEILAERGVIVDHATLSGIANNLAIPHFDLYIGKYTFYVDLIGNGAIGSGRLVALKK